jgi:hypothetical protein
MGQTLDDDIGGFAAARDPARRLVLMSAQWRARCTLRRVRQ